MSQYLFNYAEQSDLLGKLARLKIPLADEYDDDDVNAKLRLTS